MLYFFYLSRVIPLLQVLMKQSFQGAVGVYVGAALLATLSSTLLPIETRGRELRDRGPS